MREEQTESNEAATITQAEPSQPQPRGITRITVQGFKSLRDETSIEIRPLTILAGANSSGKSSIMQPLLLMKQTLEASYDPGPLKLDGPNVYFSKTEQMLSSLAGKKVTTRFSLRLDAGKSWLAETFEYREGEPIELAQMVCECNEQQVYRTKYHCKEGVFKLRTDMSDDEIQQAASFIDELQPPIQFVNRSKISRQPRLRVGRKRCFLGLERLSPSFTRERFSTYGEDLFSWFVLGTIHVPALRGNPERNYKRVEGSGSAVFPGTFENYAASLVYSLQRYKGSGYSPLSNSLESLGLASSIEAIPVSDVELEIRVARLPRRGRKTNNSDTVSIADVGLGVSQSLSVVAALLVAKPGQLVYIDQPELHLHPKAQAAMAMLLADAAKRGVRLVVETHSDTLLLAVRTLVAEGKLDPELVKLHWFTRDDEGVTHVNSTDLDAAGAYGDWPEDFSFDFYNVESELENRYLDAAEARLLDGSATPEHHPSANGSSANGHKDESANTPTPEAASK